MQSLYKRFRLVLMACCLGGALFTSCDRQPLGKGETEGYDEDLDQRTEWETHMLADPATGRIPDNIRAKELAFAATLPVYHTGGMSRGAGLWDARGPWNVGGRTRAIAIDRTNENILLAGSVSNGVWRSTDGGSSWNKAFTPSQQPNVTCLVQQPNAARRNVWYCGTGEFIGNSASGPDAFFLGNGLLKSTDGGQHWKAMSSTTNTVPQSFVKEWQIVNNIALDPQDTNKIYAATYGSIYRSDNGGTTWTAVKGSTTVGIKAATYTDVATTSAGVVYCTLSSDATQKGIYKSTDGGKTWINITPASFPGNYQRVVIGIAPSDENQVWFLGVTPNGGKQTVDFSKKPEWNSLWKYNAQRNSWQDMSAHLPAWGGDFGNFNSQTGYDLLVRVKPDDTSVVYVGGTNLWRSTDGFTSDNNTSWIGGYGVNTMRPDYKMYPNHHPDQHNLIFYPSNPHRMISTNDGGIERTEDNMAPAVSWTKLNNGYISSQFYSVAVDHATVGNDELVGGLQDNGTYLTRTNSLTQSWDMAFSSDGGVAYIADNRTDYYVSTQLGKVYRLKLDASGSFTQMARVDPFGAKGQDFVDPYELDPNQQTRMYYVARNRLWINQDVTQIPLHTQLDTVPVTTGWSVIDITKDTTKIISAVSVSRKPADIVYYGTSTGQLYKLTGASGSNPVKTNISGSNFPSGAYINNIAIDPDNADRFMVVFSNYAVKSLFYTTNGGKTYTDVSGNLEQIPASGGGNGPSCRWAAILPLSDGHHAFFVGTSTGLYSTDTLVGNYATQWTQQNPDGIGNAIVTCLDMRPQDGLIAVATHGAGMYSAHFYYGYQATGVQEIEGKSTVSVNCFPNPFHEAVTIEVTSVGTQKAVIDIIDERGRIMYSTGEKTVPAGRQQFRIEAGQWPKGIYYARTTLQRSGMVTRPILLQ